MKKYIFCYLFLGGFWIGGASVEGMELLTTKEKGLKKYVFISPSAIPDYSFEGKERIRFIPESKIKKIPAIGEIPSLKDLCLDFLVSQIELGEDGPSKGEKEAALGQVEIVSEEEEEDSWAREEKDDFSLSFLQRIIDEMEALKNSHPGEEKGASSLSFFQRVDAQIKALSKNCPLNEDLESLLKVRICQKRGGMWEEWGKLSEEERNKQGGISFLREIGKEDFLDFFHCFRLIFRLKDENKKPWENVGVFLGDSKNPPENLLEHVEKVFDEIAPFYSLAAKIKIDKFTNSLSEKEILDIGIQVIRTIKEPSMKQAKEELKNKYGEENEVPESEIEELCLQKINNMFGKTKGDIKREFLEQMANVFDKFNLSALRAFIYFWKKKKDLEFNLESMCFVDANLFRFFESSVFTPKGKNLPTYFHILMKHMSENLSLNLKELILDGVFMMSPREVKNLIMKEVWKDLGEPRCFQGLETLNLRWNNLEDTDIKKLVEQLKDKKFLPCLRSLILEGNDIRGKIVQELWEVLKERPCFQVLDLTGNPVFHSYPSCGTELLEKVANYCREEGIDSGKFFLKKTRFETVNLFDDPFVREEDLWIQGKDLPLYAVTDKKPLVKMVLGILGYFQNI